MIHSVTTSCDFARGLPDGNRKGLELQEVCCSMVQRIGMRFLNDFGRVVFRTIGMGSIALTELAAPQGRRQRPDNGHGGQQSLQIFAAEDELRGDPVGCSLPIEDVFVTRTYENFVCSQALYVSRCPQDVLCAAWLNEALWPNLQGNLLKPWHTCTCTMRHFPFSARRPAYGWTGLMWSASTTLHILPDTRLDRNDFGERYNSNPSCGKRAVRSRLTVETSR